MDKIIHIPGFDLRVTRRLVVDLSLHFFITMSFAVLIYVWTKKISWSVMVITGGILIDTDHFLDHFLHLDKWNLTSFLHGHFAASNKLYLIFHAWEVVISLALLGLLWPILLPLALGMAEHLTIDTLMHFRRSPLSYFILYRWKHRFSYDKINYYMFLKQMKNLKNAGLIKDDHISKR